MFTKYLPLTCKHFSVEYTIIVINMRYVKIILKVISINIILCTLNTSNTSPIFLDKLQYNLALLKQQCKNAKTDKDKYYKEIINQYLPKIKLGGINLLKLQQDENKNNLTNLDKLQYNAVSLTKNQDENMSSEDKEKASKVTDKIKYESINILKLATFTNKNQDKKPKRTNFNIISQNKSDIPEEDYENYVFNDKDETEIQIYTKYGMSNVNLTGGPARTNDITNEQEYNTTIMKESIIPGIKPKHITKQQCNITAEYDSKEYVPCHRSSIRNNNIKLLPNRKTVLLKSIKNEFVDNKDKFLDDTSIKNNTTLKLPNSNIIKHVISDDKDLLNNKKILLRSKYFNNSEITQNDKFEIIPIEFSKIIYSEYNVEQPLEKQVFNNINIDEHYRLSIENNEALVQNSELQKNSKLTINKNNTNIELNNINAYDNVTIVNNSSDKTFTCTGINAKGPGVVIDSSQDNTADDTIIVRNKSNNPQENLRSNNNNINKIENNNAQASGVIDSIDNKDINNDNNKQINNIDTENSNYSNINQEFNKSSDNINENNDSNYNNLSNEDENNMSNGGIYNTNKKLQTNDLNNNNSNVDSNNSHEHNNEIMYNNTNVNNNNPLNNQSINSDISIENINEISSNINNSNNVSNHQTNDEAESNSVINNISSVNSNNNTDVSSNLLRNVVNNINDLSMDNIIIIDNNRQQHESNNNNNECANEEDVKELLVDNTGKFSNSGDQFSRDKNQGSNEDLNDNINNINQNNNNINNDNNISDDNINNNNIEVPTDIKFDEQNNNNNVNTNEQNNAKASVVLNSIIDNNDINITEQNNAQANIVLNSIIDNNDINITEQNNAKASVVLNSNDRDNNYEQEENNNQVLRSNNKDDNNNTDNDNNRQEEYNNNEEQQNSNVILVENIDIRTEQKTLLRDGPQYYPTYKHTCHIKYSNNVFILSTDKFNNSSTIYVELNTSGSDDYNNLSAPYIRRENFSNGNVKLASNQPVQTNNGTYRFIIHKTDLYLVRVTSKNKQYIDEAINNNDGQVDDDTLKKILDDFQDNGNNNNNSDNGNGGNGNGGNGNGGNGDGDNDDGDNDENNNDNNNNNNNNNDDDNENNNIINNDNNDDILDLINHDLNNGGGAGGPGGNNGGGAGGNGGNGGNGNGGNGGNGSNKDNAWKKKMANIIIQDPASALATYCADLEYKEQSNKNLMNELFDETLNNNFMYSLLPIEDINTKKKYWIRGDISGLNSNKYTNNIALIGGDIFSKLFSQSLLKLQLLGGTMWGKLENNSSDYNTLEFLIGPKLSLLHKYFIFEVLGLYRYDNVKYSKNDINKFTSNIFSLGGKLGFNICIANKIVLHPYIHVLVSNILTNKPIKLSNKYQVNWAPGLAIGYKISSSAYIIADYKYHFRPVFVDNRGVDLINDPNRKGSNEFGLGVNKSFDNSVEISLKGSVDVSNNQDTNSNKKHKCDVKVQAQLSKSF